MGAWATAVIAAAASAHAAPKKRAVAPPTPASFEDPCIDRAPDADSADGADDAAVATPATCQHHALDAFTTAMAAQHAGTAAHPLRIAWFGGSLTADDQDHRLLAL